MSTMMKRSLGLYETKEVLYKDRVRTKTGRIGVCLRTIGRDTALVQWDDGEAFPIRFCHLEVLAHNCEPVRRWEK